MRGQRPGRHGSGRITDMPVVTNGAEAYQGDQLVAEREYAGLIQEELRRLQVASSVLDSHPGLGLALMSLPDAAASAAMLRMEPALVEAASRAWLAHGQPPDHGAA